MCNCLECEYSERAAYGGKPCLACYKELKPDIEKLVDEIEKSIGRQRFIGKFRTIKEATKHKDCANGVTALTSRYLYVRVGKTWEKLCKTKEILKPNNMYLKVEKDSPIYGKLSQIFIEEQQRNESFKKWLAEHLPPFNGDVITERMAWSLSVVVVGWKFDGEVDSKTWQPMKEFPDYYEPNRRTKAGKRMRERIYTAMGNMFNCINFFEMFGTSIPYYGKSFTVPKGFLHNNTVYMIFDDANYNDISKNMAGQFAEITTGEFNEALDSYNESQKGKGL